MLRCVGDWYLTWAAPRGHGRSILRREMRAFSVQKTPVHGKFSAQARQHSARNSSAFPRLPHVDMSTARASERRLQPARRVLRAVSN